MMFCIEREVQKGNQPEAVFQLGVCDSITKPLGGCHAVTNAGTNVFASVGVQQS
jgi:hypothetical protein